MIATFSILQICQHSQMLESWFFVKMRREKLYKNCTNKSLLTYYDVVSYTQNEQVTWLCYDPPYLV